MFSAGGLHSVYKKQCTGEQHFRCYVSVFFMPFKMIGGLNVDRDSMMGMLIVSYDRACTREEAARSSLLSGRRISCNGRVRKMERWAFLAANSGQYQASELHQKGGRTEKGSYATLLISNVIY